MKNLKTTLLFLVSAFILAGCNTTRGIGQDIEATGEVIEDVAEETREKMNND